MKIKYFIIAILILTGVATISCSKKKLNKKIEGKWERIDFRQEVNTGTATAKEYWTFADNSITITIESTDGAVSILDQGTYSLKIKLETKEFVAKGFGEGIYADDTRKVFYNTKWIIDRLKDDAMGIYSDKDNNLLFYDFVKVD